MLIRSLPDSSWEDAEFQRQFHSKWGRESCIIWGRARHAEFGPYTHTLSIRAAWGGAEYCWVDGRMIAVDDDNFLILNHGQIYSTSIRSERPVESLAICFQPALVERIRSETAASIEEALWRGDADADRPPDFFQNLHPHEQRVSPVLRFIRAHLRRGIVDEAWCEEHLILLLARMQHHRKAVLEHVDRLALVRPATRREVYRRIGLATDFLHTNYAKDIDLGMLARPAYLSKYHFLRLFTLVHGMSPRTYLQRKRIGMARRLLEGTDMTVTEVASSVGFADQTTLQRHMRRWMMQTPLQIRAQARGGAVQ